MILKKWVSFAFMLTILNLFSQDISFSTLLIDKSLKENANAIIRNHETVIELHDFDDMTVTERRTITILNKNGLGNMDAVIYYNPSIKVKSYEGKVFGSNGEELKKFRNKDYNDYSRTENQLYSEERMLVLDYTPTEYPFTFNFEVVLQTNTTAGLYSWYPIQNYFVSTEKSSYKIINEKNIELSIEELNLENDNISNSSEGNIIQYSAKNMAAFKSEYMSPAFNKIAPIVKVVPKKFKLINVNGEAKNWNDFGKWYYDNLLIDCNDLPESTKIEVANLVKDIVDPIEKAKVIYQYVQDKTRYISVQLGIGGWQPMLASQVDNLSYGDCKALTNYTKSLMESQGIEANYTILNGDSEIVDIEKKLVGIQGNHVILNLPNNGDPIWLECTSQKVPFGFIANFTDDRDVLVVTPEGGRIEHTKVYSSKESYLNSIAEVTFNENGGIDAKIDLKSGGIQYDSRFRRIIDANQKDRDKYYKNYWDYINGISLVSLDIKNDRDKIEISENIEVSVPTYASIAGEKLLVNPNMFNRYTSIPPRYSDRKLPFVIERGFYDTDEYIINLPIGYKLETTMQDEEISSQFGIYKVKLEVISDTKVKYIRSLEINKGNFNKDDYDDYRNFIREVAKADKSSIVLNKSI